MKVLGQERAWRDRAGQEKAWGDRAGQSWLMRVGHGEDWTLRAGLGWGMQGLAMWAGKRIVWQWGVSEGAALRSQLQEEALISTDHTYNLS